MRSNKTAAVGHKMKTSFGSKLFDVFNVLLMCLLMLIILIPPVSYTHLTLPTILLV